MLWKKIIKDQPLYIQGKTKIGELLRKKIIVFVKNYILNLNSKIIVKKDFKLDKLHHFLKPEEIPLLQIAIEKKFKREICKWIMDIAENQLNMKNEYYIDQKFYFRINFPFDYAVKSKGKDPKHPLHRYNKGLPKAAWSHGPHIDTWYGHSFKAINFWWNVDGVNPENSMTLHLKKDTSDLEYDEFMYLDPNTKPPNLTKIDLQEGELLLFNSEQLHATRLNTSSQTRFVITTRVIQDEPTFNKSINHRHYLQWMSSEKIKKGDYTTKEYRNFIEVKTNIKNKKILKKKININVSSDFKDKEEFDIPKIRNKEIINVNYNDRSVLLALVKDNFFAFSKKCPHLGVSLENGFILGDQIKCPAHGAEFDLKDGVSGCKLKLKTYKVKVLKNNTKLAIL